MSTQPVCYGKRWDPNDVECKGGLDPAYENPRDQTHRRDKCSWFAPCSHVVQSRANVTQTTPPSMNSPLIPTQSLVHRPTLVQKPATTQPAFTPPRPPTYTPPMMPTPSYATSHYQQPIVTQQPHVQQQQYYVAQPQGMVPPHVAQYGPALVNQPYQLPGSQMPQYLTVPEPVNERIHWLKRLGHELLRSFFKALGHTLAAHMDSNPINRHK